MNKKLEKIIKVEPKNNGKGSYIAYCNFSYHRGVISGNDKQCKIRKCKYYKQLYIKCNKYQEEWREEWE